MISRESDLSMARQCSLLGIHRSGIYYEPEAESALNLRLMRLMDEKYLQRPYFGVPRMYDWLRYDEGFEVNYKRVERLYKLMGLRSVLPGRNTSKPGPPVYKYPYLLRGLKVETANHVWGADITYIPMMHGYMYLFAVMDLYSRFIVGWDLSSSMDASWCASVFCRACERYGAPLITNTDQGAQFTSEEWTSTLRDKKTQISMDGKGRALDNVLVERLWWSVKYEHVYLHPASNGSELFNGLREYFHFYHVERRHESLSKRTPSNVFHRILSCQQKEKRSKKEKL